MNRLGGARAIACVALVASTGAAADPPPDVPPAADTNRVIVSGEWASLSGEAHGGGGAVVWVGGLTPTTQASAGLDYHSIAGVSWDYASLGGVHTFLDAGGSPQLVVAADIHEGSGRAAGRSFDYAFENLSLSRPLTARLTLQLEDRQIDVDTSHANLPKLLASWAFPLRWQAAAGYAHSVGGNTRTQLASLRVDHQAAHGSLLIGAALGHTAPAVINLPPGALPPGSRLREGFAGCGWSFGVADVLLVGDYLTLAGVRRLTVTLAITLHPGRGAR